MQEARIQMKDGSRYSSPLWYFKPKEGYLTIQDEDGTLLHLRDMTKATLMTEGTDKVASEDIDLLKKAQEEGWDGK